MGSRHKCILMVCRECLGHAWRREEFFHSADRQLGFLVVCKRRKGGTHLISSEGKCHLSYKEASTQQSYKKDSLLWDGEDRNFQMVRKE